MTSRCMIALAVLAVSSQPMQAQSTAEERFNRGRIASVELDEDKAIDEFEAAVRLDERNALYHRWLGNAICDKTIHSSVVKQPFMARRVMREWTRAVMLDPTLDDARLSLVQFFSVVPGFMGGGIGRAREQGAELAKRNTFYASIADAYIAEAQKKPAEIEKAYLRGVAAAPDSLISYVLLAEAYVRQGRGSDAFKALDSYGSRHPENPWIEFQTGRIAAATGLRLDDGEKALQAFVAHPPQDATPRILAEAQYRLAQIAERKGAKADAKRYHLAARQINPNVDVVKNLRSLTCR